MTDTITGLVWQRDGSVTRAGCAAGMAYTWAEAKAYCAALVFGVVSGWRLPPRMELRTIVDPVQLDADELRRELADA